MKVRFSALVVATMLLLIPASASAIEGSEDPSAKPAAVAADESPAPEAAKGPKGGKEAGGEPGLGLGVEGEPQTAEPRESKVKLRVKGLSGGKLKAGKKVTAKGVLIPFAKGERVTIEMKRGKRTIKRKTVTVKQKEEGSRVGQVALQNKVIKPGRYSFTATHKESKQLAFDRDRSKNLKMKYPDLREGNRSSVVKIFNGLLARQGYVNDKGKAYDSATGRAVLAFRKVNGMSRDGGSAPSSIFKRLANGKGGYNLKYPKSGKHVEIDISRQVMVLAKGGKVDEIYHVSTGAPSTPTIPGTWRFYRKEAGTNHLGMQWSIYYNRGYATHGFKSVPTYPASHGCTRNPPANAVHIYNWIDIGDLVHVYR